MALIFDPKVFKDFHKLAVTDVSKLEIGKTYYSNSYPERFTLTDVISDKEHWIRWKKQTPGCNEEYVDITIAKSSEELKWMVDENFRVISLEERNIGASYNPWMIFDDENVARACKEQLVVTIESDMYDDPFRYLFLEETHDYPVED